MEMPVGYSRSSSGIITFEKGKAEFSDLLSVDNFTEQQRIDLTIANWRYGCWEDLYFNGELINLERAIEEVIKKSEIGIELVRLTMLGFEHIYESLNPEKKQEQINAAPRIISAAKQKLSIQPANFNILIYNQLDSDVIVYKQDSSGTFVYVCNAPHDSSQPEGATVDYIGQVFEARLYNGNNYTIAGAYLAYPGNTNWDIVSFEPGTLMPSCYFGTSNNVTITNNLSTYIEVWYVFGDGTLWWLGPWSPGYKNAVGPCYIGGSFVATQGETIIDEFIIEDDTDVAWNINPVSNDEIFLTGANSYIFYQATNPQNDLKEPQKIVLEKTITVGAGVPYLYAGFDDATDIYYAFPQGVVLQITDPNGNIYNQTVIPDGPDANLYVQMSMDNSSLYHLCVKNPAPGNWTIQITGHTNISFRFQFQTIPTADVYSTIKQTLQPVFNDMWQDVALKGITNVLSGKPLMETEDQENLEIGPLVIFLVGVIVVLAVSGIVIAHNAIKATKAASTKKNKLVPIRNTFSPPTPIGNILLADDDTSGDESSAFTYKMRKKYLYPNVLSGAFSSKYTSLVGADDTQTKFSSKLQASDLIYVSVNGHGNNTQVFGNGTEVLLDSSAGLPSSVSGKIFHLFACLTGNNLGPALVTAGAKAFIGYKVSYTVIVTPWSNPSPFPDTIIDNSLISGKTTRQAQRDSYRVFGAVIAYYTFQINPTLAGTFRNMRANLVGPDTDPKYGDPNAKLFD